MSNDHDIESVEPAFACPHCGERNMDLLVWIEDDRVECQTCGRSYDPANGKGVDHEHNDQ